MQVTMGDADLNRVVYLVREWRAARLWAEDLICLGLHLAAPMAVLALAHENAGWKEIPGTGWGYGLHGTGIDICRQEGLLGIAFDPANLDPDPHLLRHFTERQLQQGRLGSDSGAYARLLGTPDLFDALALRAIADARGRGASTRAERQAMRAALAAAEPSVALVDLVKAWKAAGCTAETAEARLTQRLLESAAFGAEPQEDLVCDVLDLVTGWCAPGAHVFAPR